VCNNTRPSLVITDLNATGSLVLTTSRLYLHSHNTTAYCSALSSLTFTSPLKHVIFLLFKKIRYDN